MTRLLIIPAAGLGTRLSATVPKILYPLEGRPLLDYLVDLYQALVDRIVLVLHPSFADDVRRHCARGSLDVDLTFQAEPGGMLPALLVPQGLVSTYAPTQVWATWCDQVAIHPHTVDRLRTSDAAQPAAAFSFPTVWRADPYIHFVRDSAGAIIDVLQQREGDSLPRWGESDAGLFSFSRAAYLDLLVTYARTAPPGVRTGETNFLPFIPWLARRAPVRTFPVLHEAESVGINTPEDIERVRGYLREREEGAVGRHSRLQ